MIRIIENCYSSKWLKISIQIHKEFFSSVRPNLRKLRVHFSLVHQLHNSHCTWSRTELGIIIRVQRRIRTHGEEFGLASEENAVVPVWQLHPGTIVLCAPINSAHAVIRDIVVVHAKCILPAPTFSSLPGRSLSAWLSVDGNSGFSRRTASGRRLLIIQLATIVFSEKRGSFLWLRNALIKSFNAGKGERGRGRGGCSRFEDRGRDVSGQNPF